MKRALIARLRPAGHGTTCEAPDRSVAVAVAAIAIEHHRLCWKHHRSAHALGFVPARASQADQRKQLLHQITETATSSDAATRDATSAPSTDDFSTGIRDEQDAP